jgi:hypothetical protein
VRGHDGPVRYTVRVGGVGPHTAGTRPPGGGALPNDSGGLANVRGDDSREGTRRIRTAAETRALVKQYNTRGIVDLARIKATDALGRWDKVESALTPVE